jgi:hypothetical protein
MIPAADAVLSSLITLREGETSSLPSAESAVVSARRDAGGALGRDGRAAF